jgi:hypothetical protein
MFVIVPSSLFQDESVRGIRSLSWWTLSIMNCPALAFAAMAGACIVIFLVAELSCCLSTMVPWSLSVFGWSVDDFTHFSGAKLVNTCMWRIYCIYYKNVVRCVHTNTTATTPQNSTSTKLNSTKHITRSDKHDQPPLRNKTLDGKRKRRSSLRKRISRTHRSNRHPPLHLRSIQPTENVLPLRPPQGNLG